RYFDRCRDTNGFGWLTIDAAGFQTVFEAARDITVDKILVSTVLHTPRLFKPRGILDVLGTPAAPVFDTNDPAFVDGNREGLYRIPVSTKDGRRNGVTVYIYATKDHPVYGANLTIWEDTLVTKVKFDNGRAQGLEYFKRKRTFRADRDDTRL